MIIGLNVASWFAHYGCRVGANHQPLALCKHAIAGLIKTFLKVNNLKLVEDNLENPDLIEQEKAQ